MTRYMQHDWMSRPDTMWTTSMQCKRCSLLRIDYYDGSDSGAVTKYYEDEESPVCYYRACVKNEAPRAFEAEERRELSRETCGANGCDLTPEHAGNHRAVCGCINGCKAVECPNL